MHNFGCFAWSVHERPEKQVVSKQQSMPYGFTKLETYFLIAIMFYLVPWSGFTLHMGLFCVVNSKKLPFCLQSAALSHLSETLL